MLDTRHGKQYRYEMDDRDHESLLALLLEHKGPVIISEYETELYNNMLVGWNRYETTAYSQVCSKKKEAIWMNFEPVNRQMTFDDYGGIL